jgi:hypothetical protein
MGYFSIQSNSESLARNIESALWNLKHYKTGEYDYLLDFAIGVTEYCIERNLKEIKEKQDGLL